mmetsp:Transcript_7573/g.16575  ORF Transcript_7573/g.16575 Transcript_7573/m.16575 type:complete len:94 (+) Transcript_7573:163-444(+)
MDTGAHRYRHHTHTVVCRHDEADADNICDLRFAVGTILSILMLAKLQPPEPLGHKRMNHMDFCIRRDQFGMQGTWVGMIQQALLSSYNMLLQT